MSATGSKRVPPPCASTTLEDLASHSCKFQKTMSIVSESDESDVTVDHCNESVLVSPPLQLQQGPVEAHQQCRYTRPAVGQVLQLVLQGMAPTVACLGSELGALITDKLAGVLDAAEADSRESINTGIQFANSELLSRLAKLTEENQLLKAQAAQTEHRMQIRDTELALVSASLSDKDCTIAKQEEDIKSYRSMAKSYQDMYVNVTAETRMSPTWLDEAMEVPVVRLSADSVGVLPSVAHGAARSSEDDEDEDEDELGKLNDDGDVMEIMMRSDIRKFGVEKTSQRWACHQFIFHHLAIKDASVIPPAETELGSHHDGRMYS